MATAYINGTDIHYEDSGGDGPALLFSHGFLMDHTMFDAQVDVFRDSYRCIAWDERGFGGTRATGPFTYWDSADDAVALLDHWGSTGLCSSACRRVGSCRCGQRSRTPTASEPSS